MRVICYDLLELIAGLTLTGRAFFTSVQIHFDLLVCIPSVNRDQLFQITRLGDLDVVDLVPCGLDFREWPTRSMLK